MRFRCLCVLLAFVTAAACSSKSESPEPSAAPPAKSAAAPAKDPKAARELIASGAAVLDVRTPDEFASGHVPSATNVPIQDFAQRLAEVDALVKGDKTKPVVVYCGAGSRAARAKKQLEDAGYAHVVNGGGYNDLQ